MTQRDHPRPRTIRERLRPRLAALAIGAIGVILIGGIALTMLFLSGEFDAADPPSTPTEIAPATSTTAPATPSPLATPATPEDGEPEYPAGSLPGMLAMAPDRIDNDDTGLPIQATWSDLAAWFEILGIDPASANVDEMESAMEPLEMPGVLRTRGLSDDWRDVYGFSVREIHQVITVGHAPDQVLIMHGDFSPDDLYDTWVRNGYFAVEVQETTIWSLFPGDRIDLTAPASRPALGLLNNIVMLDDDTIIASARQSGMTDALRVANGNDPSLLEHSAIEEAVAVWEDSGAPVTAILADGTIVEVPVSGTITPPGSSEGTAVATPLADAPLPEVEMILFGVLPGTDDPSATRLQAILMYDDAPDGLELVPSIVKARIDVSDGWSNRYQLESVGLLGEDASMIQVAISRTGPSESWAQVIEERDLAPLHWSDEP